MTISKSRVGNVIYNESKEVNDEEQKTTEDEKGEDGEDDSDEEDYMTMTFAEQTEKKPETSLQRRLREKREAELKSRPKSKAQVAEEEAATREATLNTSLDASNKGFKMMAKLGFKGGALGKEGTENARTEPIGLEVKEGRGGIGLDSERKRKFREEMAGEVKRVKESEEGYRARMRAENEAKRLEGQITGAMVIAEKFDEADANSMSETQTNKAATSRPLKSINVLWRGLVRLRREQERERRMRYDLHQSLSSIPTYDDSDDDSFPRPKQLDEEEELEEEDVESDEFNALLPETRLSKLVLHLRKLHNYCFWCKHQYDDSGMHGCPGETEADHD